MMSNSQSSTERSCTSDAKLHYSFDYAQQVFCQHYAQQGWPLYFKTPHKCQCFGVCGEASGSQIFYLVDERHQSVDKGAKSVASLLHHHFEYLSYGEKYAVMNMDNCSCQNKKNTVIGMTANKPGTVFGRSYTLDEETETSLLKKDACLHGNIPDRLPQQDLDPRRMWYLYDEIAPLCHNSANTCQKSKILCIYIFLVLCVL